MHALDGVIFDIWTHNKYPQIIKKCDKEYIKNLDYTDVTFPVA